MLKEFKLVKITIIAILVVSLLAGFTGFASLQEEASLENLSLEDAIEMALEGNKSMRNAEISLDRARVARRAAVRAFDNLDDLIKNDPLVRSNYDTRQPVELAKERAIINESLEEVKYESTERSIKLAVESNYYGALLEDEKVQIAKDSLNRASEQLRITEIEYEVGRKAKTDVIEHRIDVMEVESSLNQAKRNRDIAYMKLNQVIGNEDIYKKWNLTEGFGIKNNEEIDLSEAIESALENNVDLIEVKGMYELAKKDFEIADAFYTENVSTHREKRLTLEERENSYETAKESVVIGVKEDYFDLLGLEETILVMEETIDLMREQLRLQRLRYEAGLLTSFQLVEFENRFTDIKHSLAELIHTYNIAKAQFYNDIGGKEALQ